MTRAALASAVFFAFAAPLAAGDGLLVRASLPVAGCLRAALASQRGVTVMEGHPSSGTADLYVGTAAEIARLLESGKADGEETTLGHSPWVMAGRLAAGVRAAGTLSPTAEAAVPAGALAAEARRALGPSAKLREEKDGARLRQADLAVVPATLAPPGERTALDAPAVVFQAVPANARAARAAQPLLAHLQSEAGRQALAACGIDAPK